MKKSRFIIAACLIQNQNTRCLSAIFAGLFALGVFNAATVYQVFGQNAFTQAQSRQTSLTGDWVTNFNPSQPNEIEITFVQPSKSVPNAIGITFPLDQLQNLNSESINAAKTKVNFAIVREAGKIVWEGNFNFGRGTGIWTFNANQNYVAAMRGLGYRNFSTEDLLKAAWYDLTPKFVEDLKAAGYENPEFQQLLRARMHKIDQAYIREMNKSFGQQPLETLIWMRSHKFNADKLNFSAASPKLF